MTDRTNLRELPADLAELDAELSALRCEERPSFGPELEAELAREWVRLQGRRYWPVRQLLAAGFAGILMVGLGVPSARAALVRWVGSVAGTPAVEEEVTAPPAIPVPLLQAPPAELPGGETAAPAEGATASGFLPTDRLVERYAGPEATFPELLDRGRMEEVVRRHYPTGLQHAGIGGVVRVLLWVDSTGVVDVANLAESSGVPELDRAALQAAPSFRFEPARRRGQAVGTWVEFDVRFETPSAPEGPDWLPVVEPVEAPDQLDVTGPTLTPEWLSAATLQPPRSRLDAGAILRTALGPQEGLERLGPMEAVLAGDPPRGSNPVAWRTEVSRVLEEAMARSPDNPAPLLALSRIRHKQGLRTEARVLLERGLQRAQRSPGTVAPELLADLHFERGSLVMQGWMASRGLGRVRADALVSSSCPQARSSGGAVSGYASVDRLVAWNYLCPEPLDEILSRSFESLESQASTDRAVTQASFRSALEADPAHVRANVEILLALAEEGRWGDMLANAQRFVVASGGSPHGLLLAGLAFQRLSRSEEAEISFRRAMDRLAPDEADQIQDVAPLLLEPEATEYRRLSQAERVAWRTAFWGPLDPILATPVNERAVEHLARTSWALLRFGTTRSDPAEVWVRYGQPEGIRAFEEGPDVRTEFWDFGPGPDLTFRRLAASRAMNLTPEGRAYLDEVRELVPHRYGNASRPVFPLPAQVGRFRGGEGLGPAEVQVHARVPLALATGAEDRLVVSLVLLGASGDTLSLAAREVEAVEGDIALAAEAGSAVRGVVVEVYNPATGQAAAHRRPIPPMASAGSAYMSDVVLTFPASPRKGEVRRGAAWLEPLALDQPVRSHAIGAYVELYGLARVVPWYRLRAEIVDRATGDIRDLPIQPAGEEGFRATWDRRPAGSGATREFVSVWLGDVPPGRYTLRLVADAPDLGAPLAAQQEMDRR